MKKHILKEGIEIIVPDGASMVFGVVDKEEKRHTSDWTVAKPWCSL